MTIARDRKENVGHLVGTIVRMWAKPDEEVMKGFGWVMRTSVHLGLFVKRLELKRCQEIKAATTILAEGC